jgi:hypothetical protein
MAGPTYHAERATGRHRLPAHFDDKVFLYEWARDWIGVVHLDESGYVLTIEPFLSSMKLTRPMDLELGPDGCLYLIEWGTGFGGGNEDSRIVRLEHYPGGERPPRAVAAADRRTGAAPLTVSFSSEGSAARDGSAVKVRWDVDGDGRFDRWDANPRHVYEEPGNYTAIAVVMDVAGQMSTASIPISVGNTRPDVRFAWPPDGGFFEFGDTIRYDVEVDDPEDAVIEMHRLRVQPYLGHDTHAHPLHRYRGLRGTFETIRDDGHGADADLFTVIAATYTDGGGAGSDAGHVAALTGRSEVVLQPKRKHAEYATAREAARVEKTDDPDGGGQALVFEKAGAWASYAPVNLHAIDAVEARMAVGAAGGALELRLDAPDGPLLATLEEAATAEPLTKGRHGIRVEYFERGGGAGLILRVSGPGLEKQVVPAAMFESLWAYYYDLDDPTELPDFAGLESYARERIDRIHFPSSDGAFAGSERSEQVGVVFRGDLVIDEPGTYSFFLESDDGSRLWIDDRLVVDNDGLHAMVEKASAMRWTNTRVPITDPGGTHVLYVVRRDAGGGPLKLNWLEFHGRGVTEE